MFGRSILVYFDKFAKQGLFDSELKLHNIISKFYDFKRKLRNSQLYSKKFQEMRILRVRSPKSASVRVAIRFSNPGGQAVMWWT